MTIEKQSQISQTISVMVVNLVNHFNNAFDHSRSTGDTSPIKQLINIANK